MAVKVLDAKGRELTEGCTVKHADGSGPAPFLGVRWRPGQGWSAQVHWYQPGWPAWEWLHPGQQPDTYRCPDLELIDLSSEGAED